MTPAKPSIIFSDGEWELTSAEWRAPELLAWNGEAIDNTRARKVTRQWSQGKVPQLEEKDFMSDYPIDRLVDSPAAGFARVEAFFTAGDSAVYAILPRRPLKDIVLDDIAAPSGVRVTLLEGGQPLEAAQQGSQLTIRIPDSLAAALPARQAYVLKIEGAQ